MSAASLSLFKLNECLYSRATQWAQLDTCVTLFQHFYQDVKACEYTDSLTNNIEISKIPIRILTEQQAKKLNHLKSVHLVPHSQVLVLYQATLRKQTGITTQPQCSATTVYYYFAKNQTKSHEHKNNYSLYRQVDNDRAIAITNQLQNIKMELIQRDTFNSWRIMPTFMQSELQPVLGVKIKIYFSNQSQKSRNILPSSIRGNPTENNQEFYMVLKNVA